MAKPSSRPCPPALHGRPERLPPVPSGSGGIQWSAEDVASKPSSHAAIAARCGRDPGVAEEKRNAGLGNLRPIDPGPKSRRRQKVVFSVRTCSADQ